MKKRIAGVSIFLILISTAGFSSQQKNLSLSLEDCILGAMKNNLNIAVEILNPEIADINASRAKERFMPAFFFNISNEKTNSASYSWFDAANEVRSAINEYTVSLDQIIPTGGRFAASLRSYKSDTNRRFQTINPRYGSTLTLDFTQPLLKNFGFKISRREIIIANNNREISKNQLNHILLNTIFQVEEAYWNLVYSIENLKVRQQTLKLAKDLMEENKRKIEVGSMAPIEIYTAQAEVATREAEILQAEALVKNNEDLLKTIINLAASESGDSVEILPTDIPIYEKREVKLEEALVTALENRADLKATKVDLKNKELNVGYAKNQLLPEINFQASYWSPGISGDQILYLDKDPLTRVVVGKIPGASTDALKDALKFKYNNWSVGLTLSIPLNTILSRAAYAEARVSLEQAMLRMKNQEQQIFLEIKTAVRAVQTNYKSVQAFKAARELAEKKLEAEEEKFRVGKSTNYLLLQYQRDAANARSTELKAIIDYNLSLAHLDRVLGTTLSSKNITLSKIERE
ncbi:MAG: TolC family protein [Candidatus Aminicenantes bacterium]|nr:MAG: TolC family protein [Candidatus Aminicenantes bacterium]